MREYLVFDVDILSKENQAAAEKFCQANRMELLQIGVDTVPPSVQCVFISTNREFISTLVSGKGFCIDNFPSAQKLQAVLNQIKPRKNSSPKTLFDPKKQGQPEQKDKPTDKAEVLVTTDPIRCVFQ